MKIDFRGKRLLKNTHILLCEDFIQKYPRISEVKASDLNMNESQKSSKDKTPKVGQKLNMGKH